MTLEEAKKNFPPMWVIYDHPKDLVGHFPYPIVARLWYADVPDTLLLGFFTIESARRHFSNRGCVCLARNETDDPVIVETWL